MGLLLASSVVLILFVLFEFHKFMLTLSSELSLDTGEDVHLLPLRAGISMETSGKMKFLRLVRRLSLNSLML